MIDSELSFLVTKLTTLPAKGKIYFIHFAFENRHVEFFIICTRSCEMTFQSDSDNPITGYLHLALSCQPLYDVYIPCLSRQRLILIVPMPFVFLEDQSEFSLLHQS
jgi:hypothetical protein